MKWDVCCTDSQLGQLIQFSIFRYQVQENNQDTVGFDHFYIQKNLREQILSSTVVHDLDWNKPSGQPTVQAGMRYTQNVIYKNGKYEEQLSSLCPRGDNRDLYLLKI